MATSNNNRLVSIDLLRGLTVMLMIFVNNGAGDSIFHTLQHSKWNGMTLADCVFPSFLFIMGMSTYLSLRKYEFRWSKEVAKKIIRRAMLLFLIGLAINWLDMAMDGRPLDFAHLRLWGVMQRLGICYLLVAVLALSCKRGFVYIIIAGLCGYSALLLYCGGYDYDTATNILARVDNALVGWDHLYHKSPVDPEGLVSTFAATFHTMIGFVVMESLCKFKTVRGKTRYLAGTGATILITGLALTLLHLPLNKRVWSTSYVCVTIGIAMLVLCLLVVAVDIYSKGNTPRWLNPVKAFGMNPLALYVGSELLAIVVGNVGIKDTAYNALHSIITNASWAGFAYACVFTAIFAAMGIWMYKRKIFVKL